MGMGVKKVAKKGVDTATGFAHQKVHQVEKDNSGVEAAHKSPNACTTLSKAEKSPKTNLPGQRKEVARIRRPAA